VQKEFALTQEFAEKIAEKIERSLDYNSSDLVDFQSAEFELNWDNRIELTNCDVSVCSIMDHVTGTLEQFIAEEDDECGPSEEEIMQSVNAGLGTQTEE